MWLIIVLAILWICYVVALVMVDKAGFKPTKALMPLILLNIIVSIGIGIDWFRNELDLDHEYTIMLTEYIQLHPISPYSIAFNVSVYIALGLVVLYMALTVWEKRSEKQLKVKEVTE